MKKSIINIIMICLFTLEIIVFSTCKKAENSTPSIISAGTSLSFNVDGANYNVSDASKILTVHVNNLFPKGTYVDIPPKATIIGIRTYVKNITYAEIHCINVLGTQNCKRNVLMELFPDTNNSANQPEYITALIDSDQNIVTVTALDTTRKIISGTFKVKVDLSQGGSQNPTNFKTITNGVFSNIHY